MSRADSQWCYWELNARKKSKPCFCSTQCAPHFTCVTSWLCSGQWGNKTKEEIKFHLLGAYDQLEGNNSKIHFYWYKTLNRRFTVRVCGCVQWPAVLLQTQLQTNNKPKNKLWQNHNNGKTHLFILYCEADNYFMPGHSKTFAHCWSKIIGP